MNGRRCPIWTLFTIILALAAVGLVVYVVLKKLHVLDSGSPKIMDEGFWPDDGSNTYLEKKDDGVPYTTDKDFV